MNRDKIQPIESMLERSNGYDGMDDVVFHYWIGQVKVANIAVNRLSGAAVLQFDNPLISTTFHVNQEYAEQALCAKLVYQPEEEEERDLMLIDMRRWAREAVALQPESEAREWATDHAMATYRNMNLEMLKKDHAHRQLAEDAVNVLDVIRTWRGAIGEPEEQTLDVIGGECGISRERVIAALAKIEEERGAALAEVTGA